MNEASTTVEAVGIADILKSLPPALRLFHDD
jgi:hypothetical protein